ncbi:MAG TPA: 2'-5' RNA ligase family protein [Stellaceae bacterium]|nr:2'-5' RNA ligase family protein [Stellaceae bacterium]
MPPLESALVILVPEAEFLVRPFRDRYDPSAAVGMPAHITLLYPFKPPDRIEDDACETLRRCFSGFAPFRFSVAEVRTFADAVLYLAPEPDEPFRHLTMAVWQRYPETPPYGDRYSEIVPHLSVARPAAGQPLGPIADEFARVSRHRLPISAIAAEVALMETLSGRWQVRTRFRLGRDA